MATSAPPMPFEKMLAHQALNARIGREMPKVVPVEPDEPNLAAGAKVSSSSEAARMKRRLGRVAEFALAVKKPHNGPGSCNHTRPTPGPAVRPGDFRELPAQGRRADSCQLAWIVAPPSEFKVVRAG